MTRRTIAILAIAWMILVVAVASSAITLHAVGGAQAVAANYETLDEVLRIIEERYYVEVEESDLLEGAIRGAFPRWTSIPSTILLRK